LAEHDVSVLLHCTVVGANRSSDNSTTSAEVQNGRGGRKIHAKAFVDYSRKCDLVYFGGALTRYGNLGKVNLGAAIIAVKEYQLQVDDVLKGRHFEDTVATGGWGLEWKENWASEFRLPDDGCFEIPLGCL
jgi:hypothetical protein